MLRNVDGKRVQEADVRALANWQPNAERTAEIPFVVARIVLQDFTGVPLLVDLAAMRSAVARLGKEAGIIEPLVPVDLVVDHSIQVDFSEVSNALQLNMEMEFKRNRARYQAPQVGHAGLQRFQRGAARHRDHPPGQPGVPGQGRAVGRRRVLPGHPRRDRLPHHDDQRARHRRLGVGGIEAEAGMLGQPVYFLAPDVVGVHLSGALRPGVTATDLVLQITEMLRKAKVVGKFVEFHGEGAASLGLTDRATIANMAPEYGATMGFFPRGRGVLPLSAGDGPNAGAGGRLPRLLPGAEPVRHAGHRQAGGGEIAYSRACSTWIWRPSSRAWPAPSARRTASHCPK